MAESLHLIVAFLLKRNNWRNWPAPEKRKWNFSYLSFHSLRLREYDIIPSFRGAERLLEKIDVAVIGGWESPMFIRTILMAKKMEIPTIQFYESSQDNHRFKNRPISYLRKWIFSKPDKFITISKASSSSLIKMGVPENRIYTLFNPVDVNWFHTFAQNHRVPQTPGHKFLYVGQLIDRKNIVVIILAFAAIRTDFDTLTIIGDGPLDQDLRDLTESLGIIDSIIFTGQQDKKELARHYAFSNTLILVSTNEVWGLVVNEALASGLHVVVSNKCGVTEILKNMTGTYICSTDQNSVQVAMQASSREWKGYIQKPEILQFTPERFADVVIEIVEST